MASSASSDAADLRRRGRQRLIGAVAIVLLLVVFVPMLLDSEPRRAREEPAVEIPDKDKAPPLPMPAAKPTPREGLAKGLANADSATPADAGTAAPQAAQPAAVASVSTAPAKGDVVSSRAVPSCATRKERGLTAGVVMGGRIVADAVRAPVTLWASA